MTRDERIAHIRQHVGPLHMGEPDDGMWERDSIRFLLAELDAATRREADFHMNYRLKCDEESKAALIRAEKAEARIQRLTDALRETTECLHDVATERGGWAWEEVIDSSYAALAEGEDTRG